MAAPTVFAWRRLAASWAVSNPTPVNVAAPPTSAVARNSAALVVNPTRGVEPIATAATAVTAHKVTSPAPTPAAAWAAAP